MRLREGLNIQYCHVVPKNIFINGNQDKFFNIGLGNKHPVKWVIVQKRKAANCHCVLKHNRQLLKLATFDIVKKRISYSEFSQRLFD